MILAFIELPFEKTYPRTNTWLEGILVNYEALFPFFVTLFRFELYW